jgi:transcriptional regulator with XRE-family HTH domain
MTNSSPGRGARIGAAVKALRERRGLTQAELADAIERSSSSIARLEQGHTRHPRKREVTAIAQVLGVTVADLERGAPDTAEPISTRTTYSGDLTQIEAKLERLPDPGARTLLRLFNDMADAFVATADLAREN